MSRMLSDRYNPTARIFKLAYSVEGRDPAHLYIAVLLPEPAEWTTVRNAWTHAVRYSAKGLDLPDLPAALKLLKARHPAWEIIDTMVLDVMWDTQRAGEDVPDVEA